MTYAEDQERLFQDLDLFTTDLWKKEMEKQGKGKVLQNLVTAVREIAPDSGEQCVIDHFKTLSGYPPYQST